MVFIDVSWAPFLNVTRVGDDEAHPSFPVLARAASMAEGGVEHSGYIDIKQPPRTKGRKLKSWRRRWVVLHEMSIPAAGRAAAKLDVYADEKTAKRCPADKHTFILEYVTAIRAAKSKTHAHAFEIVENGEAVLLLAGRSELESQTWISALRNIFWPQEIENHCYNVSIVQNEHARRLGLADAYVMTITPEVIGIESDTHNSYEWSLSMLKRFHLNTDPDSPAREVLVIECGPRSECGEATFLFRSDDAIHILASIKKNIFTAINIKKVATSTATHRKSTEVPPFRVPAVSGSTADQRHRSDTQSSSEQRYRDLLDPPMPESKRTRLMSTGSELSAACSDKMSTHNSVETVRPSAGTEEAPIVPLKKRHSVTFETPQEMVKTVDILSRPIESSDKEEEDCDYNRVLFNPPKEPQAPGNIITTFTIAEPGYQTKVLLDDRGYSHVSFNDSKKPVIEDDKTRSSSNISSHSSFSMRSASVGSRDSGFQFQRAEGAGEGALEGGVSCRSSHSFDSAVSTSSATETNDTDAIDTTTTNLKVEIHELEVDETGQIVSNEHDDHGIYQDVTIDEETTAADDVAKSKPVLLKSNSAGNFRKDENEYEDLEKYQKGRKDIWKHLGIDRRTDPCAVPPALPERPLSQKMKRKFHPDRKLFTLPFSRGKSKKSKEVSVSSSSSSDSDSDSTRDNKTGEELTVKRWPLGNKSIIVGNNELYQPVNIERFLKDEEDNMVHMRERSSSLNLNMSSSFQNASKRFDTEKRAAERRTAMWKHNRNASMNVEVLQRMNDGSAVRHKCEMALQNEPLGETVFESSLEDKDISMSSRPRSCSDSSSLVSEDDDEPIYAEVGPRAGEGVAEGEAENPFPNIDPWQAHEGRDELDRTVYENDDSMSAGPGGDLLNQCFVATADGGNKGTSQAEGLLIDFSDVASDTKTVPDFSVTKTTPVDIFAMEFDPLFSAPSETKVSESNFVDIFHIGAFTQPLIPQTLIPETVQKISEVNTTLPQNVEGKTVDKNDDETIYMDMTTCKNESIYVMPSELKQ